ncbi:MAG: molecular chaperone TorD family protein [Candidatus Bathyarchaeia archaeon]
MNTSKDSDIRITVSRAVLYGTLAKALNPNVSYLCTGTLLKDLNGAIRALPNFDLTVELKKISEILGEKKITSAPLTIEHTRLFIKSVSPPYETYYNVQRAMSKMHDLADVSAFYAAFGIKPHGEPPDHIVSELEFMSLLCLKEVNAISHNKSDKAKLCAEIQRKFIKEHLGSWLSLFCKKIQENARLRIYPALANLIHRFIMLDATYLFQADQELAS